MKSVLPALASMMLLLLSMPAAGQDYNKGYAAYQRNEDATALREWRPLAEQGHAKAQYHLGEIYNYGQVVPQDFVQAHMWWNLAATQGVGDAAYSRDNIAKIMTPAQIAEAQRMARAWKENHSK